MFRNILIPTDGSDLAAKAVEQAVLFAKEIGAKITAVSVTEPFHFLSVRPTNSNTPRSNTRNTPRLTPKKCLVSFWMLQSWPVLFATRSTSRHRLGSRRLLPRPGSRRARSWLSGDCAVCERNAHRDGDPQRLACSTQSSAKARLSGLNFSRPVDIGVLAGNAACRVLPANADPNPDSSV